MHAIGRLNPNPRPITIKDGIGDLFVAMRGQTVQEDRGGRGKPHQTLIDLEALKVPPALLGFRFLSHRGPGVGVHRIGTGDGVLINEADLADVDLAADALDGSLFRMLRQGQRVQFDLDDDGRATRLRLGSEADMETPDLSELEG